MTSNEFKYLTVGMKVNYTEPIDQSYKDRAKSMIEDIEYFSDIIDHTVVYNFGEVKEIDYDNRKVLITRNTFSGDQVEWKSIHELQLSESDQEKIQKIINREDTINNILD